MVAFNDVTKKPMATIDLKKAIGVEDDELSRNTLLSPASGSARRYSDEYDYPFGIERSFRLLFPNNQEILFFADTDDEKAQWSVLVLSSATSGLTDSLFQVAASQVHHWPGASHPTVGGSFIAPSRGASKAGRHISTPSLPMICVFMHLRNRLIKFFCSLDIPSCYVYQHSKSLSYSRFSSHPHLH